MSTDKLTILTTKSWSFYTTNLFTNAVIALLMTYVLMPGAVRMLRRWLY